MSLHDLQVRSDLLAVTSVAVGWDRLLGTFFVQVAGDDDALIVWRGRRPGEISTGHAAVRLAEPYAIVPADLDVLLEIDRVEAAGVRNGRAQEHDDA